jgi:hypothetical protein
MQLSENEPQPYADPVSMRFANSHCPPHKPADKHVSLRGSRMAWHGVACGGAADSEASGRCAWVRGAGVARQWLRI